MSNCATITGTLEDFGLNAAAVSVVFTLTAPVKFGSVLVYSKPKSIETNADGTFEINLVPGSYSMAITPDGAPTTTVTFVVPDVNTYDVIDLIDLTPVSSPTVIYVRVDQTGKLLFPTAADFFAANQDDLCTAAAKCGFTGGGGSTMTAARVKDVDTGIFYELLSKFSDDGKVNRWYSATAPDQGSFQEPAALNIDDNKYYFIRRRVVNGVPTIYVDQTPQDGGFSPVLTRNDNGQFYRIVCVTHGDVVNAEVLTTPEN